MLSGYKYRIYPTQEQSVLLDKQFGCCRFIYNWALDYSTWQYRKNNTKTYKKDWELLLPEMKQYFPFLKETNSQSLQQELNHLDNAYKRFFKKLARYPKKKKKFKHQS